MRLQAWTIAVLALALMTPGLEAQLTQPLGDMMDDFRWRQIGPTNRGGRVTDVEGLPSPSKTFYVAGAGSGIWKTTNNGTTFKQVWDQTRVISMGDLAISPSDHDIIWAGTGEEDSRNSISPGGGIFKSTDAGESWQLMGLEETQVIARIIVHPTNPDIVYVAALGHIWDSNPERGLYRTSDGGESWDLVKFISDEAGFVDLIMHPENPDVLWAAAWQRVRGPYFLQSGGPGSGLWKTVDGGDSWTEVEGDGFPTSEKGRIGLAISQSTPNVMYALVEARGEGESTGFAGNGLYRSEDGGESWQKMNDVNTRPFYYSQVRVDPLDPDRVYFSSTPVQVSTDGGETYGTTTNQVHVDHHAMWIDPNDPDRIVTGNDGGVAITYDKGGNWSYLNHVTMGQFYDISVNMDVPYRVCGGLQDNGTWCGPSRLSNGQISAYHWASIGGGDGFVSAQDPVDPNIVWSESQGGNMGRSNLATGERQSLQRPQWRSLWLTRQDSILALMEDDGLLEDHPRVLALRQRASADSVAYIMRWNWNTPFLQSAHDRDHFYAAGSSVVKSTDGGLTLVPISPDLSYADPEKIRVSSQTTGGLTPDVTGAETYATIVALDESPLQQGRLYAGTDDGRVWMTEDDGGSWTELTENFDGVPPGSYVSRVKASNHDPRRVYVTFDGHRTNDFTPYVQVSDDNGGSFRSISSDLPTGSVDFAHVVEEDPINPDLLFVGTDVGAYVSTDRGGSWQRFMTGLPAVPVHDLEVHPRDRELVAGTHGRSIWIVDIASLQHLSDAVLADGALFAPKPAFQFGYPARGGESVGQQFWQRPTPGGNAEVTYYLTDELAEAVRSAGRGGARVGGGGGAARGGGAGRAGRGQGRGGFGGGAQVTITVTGPDGEVFSSIRGPANAGLNRVSWNMRGEAPPAAEPSRYEQREQETRRERALVVQDSLLAEGWDEATLTPIIQRFTGEGTGFPGGRGRGFGGGRGGFGGDPEAFRDRPGESAAGGGRGGRGGFGQMRQLAELIAPGGDMQSLFRRFGGAGGGAPLAEPGSYTLTMTIGDESFTQQLDVGRVGEVTGGNSPFEVEARGDELLDWYARWMAEGRRR
ncbi:MAG: hypothetical protein VX815_03700 [Gemmatimonadota bacterium]|nr:hypothetical protein [Gemmatimonadota bacterium]